ncbi:MAG TPA: serine hydrolase [Gemmatimonadales bacterium]|nr:serine hydrolase [Gemmatimonadales bacterium]
MAARLIGLWGSEQVLGPRVHGTLIIRRTGWGWTAEIAGRKTAVRIAGDSVTLSLPGGEGELRATLSPDRRRIAGQWIQPVPSGNILRYTSFVSLTAAPASGGPAREWRGVVQPLEDRLSLYLLVDRQPDSSLTALLRNPDGKQRDAQLRVALDDAQLRLTDLRDSTRQLEGAYDSRADVVTLHLADLGTAAVLTRRDRTHAAGFYPHPPAPARYTYRRPADDGDGWPVAIAADAGMDAAPLAALVQRLWDVDPAARDAPLVHSVLVARHGKLVLEEYFFGFDRERPHDLRSASKTFASVLLGAAMEHGARVSPEDRVYALMPEYAATADADPRKRDMTVEHLMTMTSGLPCDENGDQTLPGNEDAMQSDTTQLDWYRYMLDLPLAHAPGTFVGYCSGGVNLVGGIVRRVTGTWLPALFQRDIAEPLGFRDYHLDLTPTGEFYLGGGAYLRPRDLLKLGQVYLDGGAWRGRRIVSRAWVERSTTCQVYVASRCADGYDWHLNEIRAGDRVYREYEANGNGGQFLIVLPELDLAVVFTAGNYRRYGIWRTFRDELVPLYIIAAVKPSAAR